MALVIANRVKESSTTTGIGTVTLGGAVTGYQAFTAIGDGNQCYYTIVNIAVSTEWEVGVGTYSSSTLTRDTVLSSSNAGAKVSFSVGNKEVFVTYPADKSVSEIDIGTAPNEIPLNQYLGSLAYQSSESAIIESGRIDVKGGGSNLLLQSQTFDNAYWLPNATTVSANITNAPDGTLTADNLIPTTASTDHYIRRFSLPATTGIFSIFLKANGYSKALLLAATKAYGFDLSTGATSAVTGRTAPTSFAIVDVGNGWYRCSISTESATEVRIYALSAFSGTTFAGDGTSSISLWGAQLEQSSTLGNYIATTTSAITLENAYGATALNVIPTTGFDTTYPMAFELASDTELVVKVKGSDGVLRSATLTLA
jgi:hypothetical protein